NEVRVDRLQDIL
ncbi:hypothetical protein KIPB_005505, partial [Kipferlia bialata]